MEEHITNTEVLRKAGIESLEDKQKEAAHISRSDNKERRVGKSYCHWMY